MARPLALITGASSGIGASLAKVFAEEGYDLVLTARREARLQALADTLGAGVSVTLLPADLSTSKGPKKLLKSIADAGREVDVLVNNAGVGAQGRFADTTKARVAELIKLNVLALTQITHALVPSMVERGRGRILNVASILGFRAMPASGVYSATKAYVLSFTESLAEELRPTGVTVTALCPGLTRTEFFDDADARAIPDFLMADPDAVARAGFDACMRGEVVHVPGPMNQAFVLWLETQPRWLTNTLLGFAARAGYPSRE